MCLNRFTDATMSCLPRVYLSIAAILLAILLSASAQGEAMGEANSVYPEAYDDYFEHIQQAAVCRSRRHHLTVRVHSKCRVDVLSRRCIGYCRSGNDLGLVAFGNMSYLVQVTQCSCCKPSQIVYKVESYACYELQGRNRVKTGEQVKIAVAHTMECACIKVQKCKNRIADRLIQPEVE